MYGFFVICERGDIYPGSPPVQVLFNIVAGRVDMRSAEYYKSGIKIAFTCK